MARKLLLPFPLLSDPEGQVIQGYGQWNEKERIAIPAIVVIDQEDVVRYGYAGRDFADRPGDEAVFDELGEHTQLTYQNLQADGNDVSAHWNTAGGANGTGRTIPHLSQLSSVQDPK